MSNSPALAKSTVELSNFFSLKIWVVCPKLTQNGPVPPGSQKKEKKFGREFTSESWKPCLLIDFVQMVTLTVGFLEWVSTTWYFLRCLRTIFFCSNFYGGFYWVKKRLMKRNFEHPRWLNQALKCNTTKAKNLLNSILSSYLRTLSRGKPLKNLFEYLLYM